MICVPQPDPPRTSAPACTKRVHSPHPFSKSVVITQSGLQGHCEDYNAMWVLQAQLQRYSLGFSWAPREQSLVRLWVARWANCSMEMKIRAYFDMGVPLWATCGPLGSLQPLRCFVSRCFECLDLFLLCAVSIGFPLGRLAAVGAVMLRGLNVLCMLSLWVSTA